MIPKVIHYCWFGGNEKSDLIKNCIQSWKKFCPDYEIIEWNESNFDINFCEYTKQAYLNKKWAFLSDVARLWIIYNYGGIYLDTDVELKRDIEILLNYEAWFASEDIKSINTGLGFAAKKNHNLIKLMLDTYTNKSFDMIPCPIINTDVVKKNIEGFKKTYDNQVIENILFLSGDGYSQYAKHYYSFSWGSDEERKRHNLKRENCRPWKWKLQCKLRNPKLVEYAENNSEKVISKIYIFTVYDLIDNGFLYYAKRALTKLIIRRN